MVSLSKIKVNYQENAVGIGRIEQISWVIISDKRNVLQKEYELQIAEDAEFERIAFESGVVESRESVNIALPPDRIQLKSSRKYHIRVRIEAENGERSDWRTGFFVTALQNNEEWKAKFITIETEADRGESRGSYVRKEVMLKKEIRAAYAHVTALGLYHFYINGCRVGEDEFTPGWTSYNRHLVYQTYEVTQFLKKGMNAIAGMIGAGWYKGDVTSARIRNHYGKRNAFSCQLAVEYEDGSRVNYWTDETWKGISGPILFSEIYDGETYDAEMEVDDFNEPGCDDSGWSSVSELPFDKSVLSAQSGCKVRRMTEVPVKRIFKTPQGDTVLDFGQNLTGWIEFHVKGSRGKKAELNCFEVLNAEGNVYLDNLRTARQTIVYVCKDSKNATYHPNFSYQGFQYARVKVWPEEVRAENFTAYALHSDMEYTGNFECSNPDLNQLHHNILWGMKSNFLDIPMDCPQRDERLGWTGDAQIFCRTATYLMDTYTFFRKWLRDLEADQTEEGGVPHVVPDVWTGKPINNWLLNQGTHSAAAWADAAVIIPWTMYQMYGDTVIIAKQYNSMKSWIKFMEKHAEQLIWNYKLQFGDWVALDAKEGSYFGATPNELTCTAYFAYSVGLFAKMAEIIGKEEDAAEYEALHEKIKTVYQAAFFDEKGHLSAQTQTAQIISLYFELVPEAYKQNVVDDLLYLLKKENGYLVTGFVGTPYFCHALSRNGHTEEAYELLLKEGFPSWIYQVKQGATTIWEHWDSKKPDGTMWSPAMNSFNHYAYGAIGEWLYRVAAGIDCNEEEAGFRKIIIAPQTGGELKYVKAFYHCNYGKIISEWYAKEDRVIMKVVIPCNTTAVIHPCGAKKIEKADGICFVCMNGEYYATAGSGSYEIIYSV